MGTQFEQLAIQFEQSKTEGIPRQAGKAAMSSADVVLEEHHPAEDNDKIVLGYN